MGEFLKQLQYVSNLARIAGKTSHVNKYQWKGELCLYGSVYFYINSCLNSVSP